MNVLKNYIDESIRNALGALVNNLDKGSSISKILATDASNDLGSITPANLASVLSVFRFVENVPQGENYDNRLKSGIYVNGFPASGRNYGVCVVFSWENVYVLQLHRDPNGLASRISYDRGVNWSTWT